MKQASILQMQLDFIDANKILNDAVFDVPYIIKYMGSKKPILSFITNAIRKITPDDKWVCDLFSGSCSVSAALRREYNFLSNDIQEYSKILACTYFSDLSNYDAKDLKEEIIIDAQRHVFKFMQKFENYFYNYYSIHKIEDYQKIELLQRNLLQAEFDMDYHLFSKYYSGTYWSFEQCVWIDSLRKAAENYTNSQIYYAIISSIMHCMSYTTQSTGHFAQYRDGNSESSVENIITYRQKKVPEIFANKFIELITSLDNSLLKLKTTTLSYEKCLDYVPIGSTIYADPPYAPVHYSRFYHALETLVKYDYPNIEHKGRYRSDRHQSPFSQKGNALNAFEILFEKIISKKCQMVLSYSNCGVVKISELIDLCHYYFEKEHYKLSIQRLNHKHSTMGRFDDGDRDVIEYLITAKTI